MCISSQYFVIMRLDVASGCWSKPWAIKTLARTRPLIARDSSTSKQKTMSDSTFGISQQYLSTIAPLVLGLIKSLRCDSQRFIGLSFHYMESGILTSI